MRSRATEPLVRCHVVLRGREAHRLDMLRTSTEAASDSEIVRHALLYFEQLHDDFRAGRKLLIRSSNGKGDVEVAISATGFAEKADGPLVKRNLILHQRSAQRVEKLKQLMGITSTSELIRQALEVYEILVENILAGKSFIVQDRAGKECQYKIPISRERPAPPPQFGFAAALRGGIADALKM